ncbi:hypothetical protein [Fictibacillus enclensis]|uniref:hypothetical protein n=1 Tax=Fictibacillus enclensis TaxID=1017270 RepID=UPI0024BFAE72|nr:hypothetical protein [Fictibacillus enclensis]WHY73437.1 hypothetical protein QNH15_05865 [Fictibacillus enclensis]
MSRLINKGILLIVVLSSIVIITISVYNYAKNPKDSSSLIVASLAIIASVISGYGAQKVVEYQEDKEKPYPYPIADLQSRYNLAQLTVKNYGPSPAYNISIKWDKPLVSTKGEIIEFKGSSQSEIPVLPPNEHISKPIDTATALYSMEDLNFTGTIKFEDGGGKKYNNLFHISFEQYRKTLLHEKEELKMYYQLQKIPKGLDSISKELNKIRKKIDNNSSPRGRKIRRRSKIH